MLAGHALAGWAQPQAAAEMPCHIAEHGRIVDVAYAVLFRVDGASQTVAPVVGECAVAEMPGRVPGHEDRAAVLHGTVAGERAAVDGEGAVGVGVFRAVAEVDRPAAGAVQRAVAVLLPVAAEGSAVHGQAVDGPYRPAAGRQLAARPVMLRLTDVAGEFAAVDGQGAVAPYRSAAVVAEVGFVVPARRIAAEGSAVHGHGSGRVDRASSGVGAAGRAGVAGEFAAVHIQRASRFHQGDRGVAGCVGVVAEGAVGDGQRTALGDGGEASVGLIGVVERVLVVGGSDRQCCSVADLEQREVVGIVVMGDRPAHILIGDDRFGTVHGDGARERHRAGNADRADCWVLHGRSKLGVVRGRYGRSFGVRVGGDGYCAQHQRQNGRDGRIYSADAACIARYAWLRHDSTFENGSG